jgi:REP element-mobilizing transposase RayT
MEWLAYFLTWHTYGTWLHGETRGSVSKVQNIYGTPFVATSNSTVRAMTGRMKQAPWTLTENMRVCVERAIRDHAAIRRWVLIALNVRSNHVHVILRPPIKHDAEAVMSQFKSWGTRRLIEAGWATSATRVWADHGSTRYIDTEESLRRAIEYVENQ